MSLCPTKWGLCCVGVGVVAFVYSGVDVRVVSHPSCTIHVLDLQAVMDDEAWSLFFRAFLESVADDRLFLVIDSHNRDVISRDGILGAIAAYRRAGIRQLRLAFILGPQGHDGMVRLFCALADLDGFDGLARSFSACEPAHAWLLEEAGC